MSLVSILRKAMQRTPGETSNSPTGQVKYITWETVQQAYPDGSYLVKDHRLYTSGRVSYSQFDRVPVAWNRKRDPLFILGHRCRKAIFSPIQAQVSRGIVEELIVANLDNTAIDVWYRRYDKLEKLEVTQYLAGYVPQTAKWGPQGLSFGLACSSGYYAVFTFPSRQEADAVVEADPGSVSLLWLGKPLQSGTMASVSYVNSIFKTLYQWIAKCKLTYAYWTRRTAWFDGGWWYYYGYLSEVEQQWETDESSAGLAQTSGTVSFGIKEMLAGTLVDFKGQTGKATATVLDWWVESTNHISILIKASWDYFYIGTNATGQGSVTRNHVYDPVASAAAGHPCYKQVTEYFTVSGGSGVLGAKKQSDKTTVAENHLFIVDATDNSILWSTGVDCSFGNQVLSYDSQIMEHRTDVDPGYDNNNLPSPHSSGSKAASAIETYGTGVSYLSSAVTISRTAGPVDSRNILTSSTQTFQMFDPNKLALLVPPFYSQQTSQYTKVSNIFGSWSALWKVQAIVNDSGFSRLWHYTIQAAQLFMAKELDINGNAIDAARLFVVLYRYPFVVGTMYINDQPQTCIAILSATGEVIQVLRDWQYGLAGQSCSLLGGNGHRVLWILGSGSGVVVTSYRLTNLDTDEEIALTAEQVVAYLTNHPEILTPDFLWERTYPEVFDDVSQLPTLTEDVDLAGLASLVPAEAGAGSVRVINDSTILDALGKYQQV